ncbi:MAG: hypothetical protein GX456_07800, partial [Verrucomicrobia bacterium]|nr:hypothetical protein [Verrucomicrobiota bacterium]
MAETINYATMDNAVVKAGHRSANGAAHTSVGRSPISANFRNDRKNRLTKLADSCVYAGALPRVAPIACPPLSTGLAVEV